MWRSCGDSPAPNTDWAAAHSHDLARAYEQIKAEFDEYTKYLNGECYCYIIKDSFGEVYDSCCGFIGFECAKEAVPTTVPFLPMTSSAPTPCHLA